MDRPPAVVLKDLNDARLQSIDTREQIRKISSLLAEKEFQYEKHFVKWNVQYEAEFKESGNKVRAAEDLRKSLALDTIDEDVYRDVFRLKAKLKMSEREERLLMAEMTALEAELAFLRQELRSMPEGPTGG